MRRRAYIFGAVVLLHTALIFIILNQRHTSSTKEQPSISVSFLAPVENTEHAEPPKKITQKKIEKQPQILQSKNIDNTSNGMVLPKEQHEIIEQKPTKEEHVDIIPPSFNAAYLQNPPPFYPIASKKLGEEGRVLLKVLVGAEGGAKKVELKASSGYERLDGAAIDAVTKWRFVSAKQAGHSIEAWVLVPIIFKLGV